MKTIAFLPLTRTNWPIMVRLAKAVRDSRRGRPLIILSNPLVKSLSREVDPDIELLEIAEMPAYTPPPQASGPQKAKGAIESRVNARLQALRRSRVLAPLLSWHRGRTMQKQVGMAAGLLSTIKPATLVVAGDRDTGFEPAMLRAAHDLGIPTVIPPSAFSATQEGLFIARRQNPAHFATRRPDFKRRFPNQWRHDPLSGEDLSFFGLAATQAYAEQGMLAENPWVTGGGASDWILVDSDDVRQRYVDLGVNPAKIVVTGHPDYDILALSGKQKDETRARLLDKYKLDPAARLLLVCLPNWAEVGFKSWEWHWRENELLCRCAVDTGCNVLLSLHPSQERERYLHLEDRHPPLRILDERLAAVLPAADIYFTGLTSSTVPWAVLSCVPTVIADHYPENDRIYAGLPGIFYVPEPGQLGGTLARLVNDEAYFRDLVRQQAESRDRYGIVDGHATERIVEALLTARIRNGEKRPANVA